MVLHIKMKLSHFFFPLMAISFLRLSKVSRGKKEKVIPTFQSGSFVFSLQGETREFFLLFRGEEKPFCVQQPLAPKVFLICFVLFGCVFSLGCVTSCMCVCGVTESVWLCVCLSVCGVLVRVHAHGAVVMAFRSFIRPSRWAISSVSSSGS